MQREYQVVKGEEEKTTTTTRENWDKIRWVRGMTWISGGFHCLFAVIVIVVVAAACLWYATSLYASISIWRLLSQVYTQYYRNPDGFKSTLKYNLFTIESFWSSFLDSFLSFIHRILLYSHNRIPKRMILFYSFQFLNFPKPKCVCVCVHGYS